MKNTIIKDAISLTIITLVAGALLGLVYDVTKAPIAQAEYEKKQKAYQAVFTEAVAFESNEELQAAATSQEVFAEGVTGVYISEILEAKNDAGEVLGYVMSFASKEGYGGEITISMGVDLSGTITGLQVLSASETAGLGAKCKEDEFTSQFTGIQDSSVTYTKTGKVNPNEIDAIGGATITTKAVTNAVNNALAFVYNNTEVTGEGANE